MSDKISSEELWNSVQYLAANGFEGSAGHWSNIIAYLKHLEMNERKQREQIKCIVYQREWLHELQKETEDTEDWNTYERKLEAINDCLKALGYNPSREEYRALVKEMREEEPPTISECMGEPND